MNIPRWIFALLIVCALLVLGRPIYNYAYAKGHERARTEGALELAEVLPTKMLPNGNVLVDNGGGQRVEFLAKVSPGFVTHVEGYQSETTINPNAFKTPQPNPRQPAPIPYVEPQVQQSPPCGTSATPCGSGWSSGYRPVVIDPN